MYRIKAHLIRNEVYVFVTQEHFRIDGAIVIDNFGAGMTPEQIRNRMSDYYLLADNLETPIALLTTNHAVIREMKGSEDSLYVFRNGSLNNPQSESKWIPVTEMYAEDWLAHFDLGDLYDRGYFTGGN